MWYFQWPVMKSCLHVPAERGQKGDKGDGGRDGLDGIDGRPGIGVCVIT